jgi:hypothetical protein
MVGTDGCHSMEVEVMGAGDIQREVLELALDTLAPPSSPECGQASPTPIAALEAAPKEVR